MVLHHSFFSNSDIFGKKFCEVLYMQTIDSSNWEGLVLFVFDFHSVSYTLIESYGKFRCFGGDKGVSTQS